LRVLIVTYYWPPAGGSGVQRWLKFVKYLQDFGITPVVYTVENPAYAIEDPTLLAEIPEGVEVLRQPIWEPYRLANIFSRGKATQTSVGFLDEKKSLFEKLTTYVRANYFIPDARKFWVKPSLSYLEKYLKAHPVDLVITTGPPQSVHLIGLGLKEKSKLKWIADFRDPWTAMGYFKSLPLTQRTIKIHEHLRNKVLRSADAVVVVGKTMQREYLRFNKMTTVLTNGFDIELSDSKATLDPYFTISHIGIMNEDQNPRVLWKVLSELMQEIEGFAENLKIQLIGKVAPFVLEQISSSGLNEQLRNLGYLPHNEVVVYQKKSQVLLVCINEVPSANLIITGKIFEYLAAKRPVLAIGPQTGDLAEIINHTHSGTVFDAHHHNELKEQVRSMYKDFSNNCLHVQSKNIEQYHRREITRKLVHLIKKITG